MAKRIRTPQAKNIDEYIAGFPEATQELMEKMRLAIQQAAPKATEAIKYAIPAFVLEGTNLIFFAGFKNHIGLYPAPREVAAFKKELAQYKGPKSTVQFPLDKPLPIGLIKRIVKFRIRFTLDRKKAAKRA